MKEKKKQHVIPQAYLKYFAINKHLFVYQLNNKFRRDIQFKGIGDKIFCNYEEYYYDFPNPSNQQYLENIFQKWESRDYEIIMNNIANKTELGTTTKSLIIDWMIMMKVRNTYFRDNFKRLFYQIDSTMYALKYGKDAANQQDKIIKKAADEKGKGFQIATFVKQYSELRKEFTKNFIIRHWVILEATNENYFLTSDNPGFSLTFSYDIFRLNLSPLSSYYNVSNKDNAIHYFPISPKYCLYLMPLLEGDLPEINKESLLEFTKSKITFETAIQGQIDSINEYTIKTAHKLVIGKDRDELKRYNTLIMSRFS